MKQKKSEFLRIIEIPYGDIGWGTDPANGGMEIFSDVQLWEGPRELDDYKICGTYHKAGIPYDIVRMEYEEMEGLEVYEAMTRTLSDMVCEALSQGYNLFIAGSYCKDAVATSGGIQRALGEDKKIGVVWLDAHSDMNRPATTTTGMLGGMPLSTMVDVDLQSWRKHAGLNVPIDSRNVILSDFRVYDKGAVSNWEKTNVIWIKSDALGDFKNWQKEIDALAERVDAIYLHVDVDILDGKYVPDHVTVAGGGPDIDTIINIIKMVMKTGKVIVYVVADVYFENDDPGKEVSTLSAMRLIGSGLESWERCVAVK